MAIANRTFRSRMLLSTAMAAAFAVPGVANAQLVRSGDLVDATDSGGNGGQLTVVDTDANTTDMTVLSRVVVANWNRFNVTTGTTVNVTNGSVAPTATLVNRVIGATSSDISGTINAPDVNLWLINQNGILFGDGASINSASFFASTIDVANQDVFDFYEGTDLFGNGTGTLNFSGSLGNTVATSSPNVTFVTDGSMMFVSEQLNLDANFDAGTGRVSFVTAADVDVSFTPGSPLTYVVNAGTTVAQGQTVAGAVEGAGVDFAMFTAAGVVNAVLQVDATVTANAAVATDNGVRLFAEQSGAGTVTVDFGGAVTSTGAVDLDTDGNFTTTQAISGSSVGLSAGGAASLADVTATGGSVTLSVNGMTAAALSATDDIAVDGTGAIVLGSVTADSDNDAAGDVLIGFTSSPSSLSVTGATSGASAYLRAGTVNAGNVNATAGSATLSGITVAAGNISASGGDVSADAIGNLSLGSVSATSAGMVGGSVEARSSSGGTVGVGAITADGAVDLSTTGILNTAAITAGGALTVGGIAEPSAVTFGGNASASSITVDTTGAFAAQNLTATAGGIDIDAASIASGALSAMGGGATLLATGNITTTSINVSGGIDADSTAGGALDLGTLASGGAIALDTTGSLTTAGITAGGALTVGGIAEPSAVTFGGNASASSITVDTTGAFAAQNLTATAGGIDIDATSIALGALSASGGGATLLATGNITTTSINVSGGIDADSTAGGALDLGTLASGGAIALDTAGSLTTAGITAGGALTVGASNVPNVTSFTGDVSAQSISIDTNGGLTAQNLTATGGAITLDVLSGNLTAGNVQATDAITFQASSPATATFGSLVSTGGAVDFIGTGPSNLTVTGLTQGTSVRLGALGGGLNVGTVTSLSGAVTLAASLAGGLVAGNVTANGGNAGLSSATTIEAGAVSSVGGIARLVANGNITATSISASAMGGMGGSIDVDSFSVGSLDFGALTATGAIVLDAPGTITTGTINAGGGLQVGAGSIPSSVTFNGNASAASIAVDSTGAFLGRNLTATAGSIDIKAASITASTDGILSATGGDVLLLSPGAILTSSISATRAGGLGGSVDVTSTANSLALGDVSATGGNVDLAAATTISTLSITALAADGVGGSIDAASTGGQTLDLGELEATGAVTLITAGLVDTADVTAGGTLSVGQTGIATGFSGGNISAGSVLIDVTGDVSTGNLGATAGAVDVSAAAITAAAVSAIGGDAILQASGNILASSITATTAGMAGGAIDVDSTGGGALTLGALTATQGIALDTTGDLIAGAILAGGGLQVGDGTLGPNEITITGNVTAQSVALTSLTSVTAQDVEATGGSVSLLGGSNGDLLAGNVRATGDISFEGASLGQAQFASLISTGGNVTNTGVIPGSVLVTGPTRGLSVNLNAGLNITVADVTSTAGSAGVRSFLGNVVVGNVSATGGSAAIAASVFDAMSGGSVTAGTITVVGGDALFGAPGNITTGAISAITNGGSAQSINASSTAGGDLNLASLAADGDITLNTTGQITAGTTSAGGNVVVGSTAEPSAVTFTDSVSASAITIDALGALMVGNMTATNAIDIDVGGTITAGDIDADLITMIGVGAITTGDIGSDQALSLGAVGGDLSVGNVTVRNAGAGLALSASGAGSDVIAGTLNTNNGNIAVTAAGAITTGAIATALSGATTAGTIGLNSGQNITVGALTAGDDVLISGLGNLASGSITAGDDVIISATGNVTTGVISTTGSGSDASRPAFTGAPGVAALGFGAETSIGSNVDIQTGGTLATGNITAQTSVVLNAAAISAQAVTAVDGNADLTAAGMVTTTAITAGNAITAQSTAGGALGLGTLDAGGTIDLDTSGSVTAAAITAGGRLTIGSGPVPSIVTLNGDASAAEILVTTTGALTALDLTATNGIVGVDAGSITAATISATGGVDLLTVGGVTTAAINSDGTIVAESTDGGALDLGILDAGLGITLDTSGTVTSGGITAGGALQVGQLTSPGAVAFTGDVTAQSITLDTTGALTALGLESTGGAIDLGADTIAAVDVLATGGGATLLVRDFVTTASITATGAIDVDSTAGGALTLGTLDADGGITLDTTGSITAAGITADGALVVGGARLPNAVTFTGNARAQIITLDTGGVFDAVDLTSTGGAITINASVIDAAVLQATGGGVTLLARGGVTTRFIRSAGAIDIDSTNGGALSLGELVGAAGITLDTTGSLTTAAISATGDLVVGATRMPGAVTFQNPVTARSITIDTTGALEAVNLTSTAGPIDIGALSIEAAILSANGGDAILQATEYVTIDQTAATGAIDIDSSGGGALNLGTLNAGAGIALDTRGTVTAGATTAGGTLVVGAANAPSLITLTGAAAAQSIRLLSGGAINTQSLTSTDGNVIIEAAGRIDSTAIAASGLIDVDSTVGGAVALGTLNAGQGITLDTTGSITAGTIAAGGALVVGGVREPATVKFTGNASARSITLDVTGAFVGQNLSTTAGWIDIDAATITAAALAATGGGATLLTTGNVTTASINTTGAIDVDSTAVGALNLGALTSGAGITLDTAGAITAAAIAATGDLVVGALRKPATMTLTGNASARSITLDVTGAFGGPNLTSTAGGIDIDARTIAANTLAATGGNVRLLSTGNITTGTVTALRAGGVGGSIDIDSIGTGDAAGTLNLGALLADLGITLDTQGAIEASTITARGGGIAANARTLTSGAMAATGGDVVLRTSGAITAASLAATRAGGAGGAIDVDSTAGGAVTLGALGATQAIAIDTSGAVRTNAITAGGNLTVGTAVRAATVTFDGAAQAANITVDASGTATTQALRAGTGTIDIEAGDIALAAGPVEAGSVILKSFSNRSIGLGSATGDVRLSDAELALIRADSLLIDAGTGSVGIAGVTFGADAGRSTVAVATTGRMTISGNLTATAGTRSVRLGGAADGTGLASRITSDINAAAINLGTNTLDLRGAAIVFGEQSLIDRVEPLSIAELVRQLVASPQEQLYNPLGPITNPVYLTAGNVTVTYSGSALFQNTAARASGNAFQGVVLAGGNSAVPALTLNPAGSGGAGANPGNAFALFGTINGFEGPAASIAGGSVISVNDAILLDASRVNGCVIGSGADCVTTIVGNVVLSVPREVVSLLVAEDRLLVPFDPLVGTNNESLFSDAARASGSDEDCEQRDANGVCVGN